MKNLNNRLATAVSNQYHKDKKYSKTNIPSFLNSSLYLGRVKRNHAKFYATETALEVVNEALQIMGGYGYTKMFPLENYFATFAF